MTALGVDSDSPSSFLYCRVRERELRQRPGSDRSSIFFNAGDSMAGREGRRPAVLVLSVEVESVARVGRAGWSLARLVAGGEPANSLVKV